MQYIKCNTKNAIGKAAVNQGTIKLMYKSTYHVFQPIPVAVRSKAWFCGRSLAGIVGSNPVGGMDVCL